MAYKWFKRGIVVLVVGGLLGVFVFGKDLASYVRSSSKAVRGAVKNSLPIEFELRRANDMLTEIIPEMHANIRLIAQEEVEVAALEEDIERGDEAIAEEQQRVSKLRTALDRQFAEYRVGGRQFTRQQVAEELSRRFEQFKESQIVLESKRRLLAARKASLNTALQLLERTESRKALLEGKIATLESKHRLIVAASEGSSRLEFDNSKIAQTEKLIREIKKRLDVAERVLAHESRFVDPSPMATVSETELLEQIDDYFMPGAADEAPLAGASSDPQAIGAVGPAGEAPLPDHVGTTESSVSSDEPLARAAGSRVDHRRVD